MVNSRNPIQERRTIMKTVTIFDSKNADIVSIAKKLAEEGKNIFILNLDLINPDGFSEESEKKDILDLINFYIEKNRLPSSENLKDYIINFQDSGSEDTKGIIQMISAYNVYDADKLKSINWKEFFKYNSGYIMLFLLKKYIESKGFDYMLIKGQTEISEWKKETTTKEMTEMTAIAISLSDIIFFYLNKDREKLKFSKRIMLMIKNTINFNHIPEVVPVFPGISSLNTSEKNKIIELLRSTDLLNRQFDFEVYDYPLNKILNFIEPEPEPEPTKINKSSFKSFFKSFFKKIKNF
jgi:hypothetical protein